MKRFDRWTIDRGSITPQGFLKAGAALTRTGVFPYRRKDGKVVFELRHPDDVFAPESLATLSMVPLTDDHPSEFISPENTREHTIGWIGENITTKDNRVHGTLVVTDKTGIARVDAGKVELSCGYTADLVEETGIYDGQEYTLRQKNIVYNHVALVNRGRMGPQVRILDAADAFMVFDEETENKERTTEMKKIKIDGKEFEVSDEVAAALEAQGKLHTDALDAATKGKVEKTELDKAVKERDELQAKLDAANEKQAKTLDAAQVDKIVDERLRIRKGAEAVLGSEAKFDGKSDLDVMKEAIAKASPSVDLKDKSEHYVRARFDAIVEQKETQVVKGAELGKLVNDTRKDDEFDASAARQKAMAEAQKAWQAPLAAVKK